MRLPSDRRRAPRARLAAALAPLVLGACAGAPSTPVRGCTVDLIARFSPSVARPTSARFLQELVQGSGYDLRFVRTLGTAHVVRLAGPDTTCDAGIQLVRRSPFVQSLDLDERQFRHATEAPR